MRVAKAPASSCSVRTASIPPWLWPISSGIMPVALVVPGEHAGERRRSERARIRPRAVRGIADALRRIAHRDQEPRERIHRDAMPNAARDHDDPRRRRVREHVADVARPTGGRNRAPPAPSRCRRRRAARLGGIAGERRGARRGGEARCAAPRRGGASQGSRRVRSARCRVCAPKRGRKRPVRAT